MKKIKFDNWRDEQGSDLDKAKRILADKNIKLVEVSKNLGLSYQTLRNYRQNVSKLDNAKWKMIYKLARLADIVYVQDHMTAKDTLDFIAYLNGLFLDIAEVVDDDDLPVINRLHEIALSDPLLVTELFKSKEE